MGHAGQSGRRVPHVAIGDRRHTGRTIGTVTIQLRGGALIDGSGRDPRASVSVTLDGDRISNVGDGSANGAAQGGRRRRHRADAAPRAHRRAFALRRWSRSATTGARRGHCRPHLPELRTGARRRASPPCATSVASTAAWRKRVARGLIPGPRIFPSGPRSLPDRRPRRRVATVRRRPSHAQPRPARPDAARLTVRRPDNVRLAARNAFRRGATQIKVCVTGGVVSFTDRLEDAQFTVEELTAAVAEAELARHLRHRARAQRTRASATASRPASSASSTAPSSTRRRPRAGDGRAGAYLVPDVRGRAPAGRREGQGLGHP